MRLGFISDLHCEFCDALITVPEVDVLIFAGDIHIRPKLLKNYFKRLRAKTDAIFLYILGNHEYYGHTFPNVQENYRNQVSKVENAFLLEKDSITINGIRFLGTTLWSDLSDPIHANYIQNGLNDFIKIRTSNKSLFKATNYHQEFEACRDWLIKQLKSQLNRDTVIITHHSPSPITCSTAYRFSKIRNGFHSDLSELIIKYNPKLWIYGHDHVSGRHKLKDTELISNQPGYPHESRRGAIVDIKEI